MFLYYFLYNITFCVLNPIAVVIKLHDKPVVRQYFYL